MPIRVSRFYPMSLCVSVLSFLRDLYGPSVQSGCAKLPKAFCVKGHKLASPLSFIHQWPKCLGAVSIASLSLHLRTLVAAIMVPVAACLGTSHFPSLLPFPQHPLSSPLVATQYVSKLRAALNTWHTCTSTTHCT